MPQRTRRAMTAEDLYRFELISEPHISPNGEAAVYALHRVDRKTERKYSNLWLVPTRRGRPRPFTQGDQSDQRPRFSPDGSLVAFLSNRADEKQPQIFLIPLEGGEARQLTHVSGSIEAFEWSPDGKRLVIQLRKKDAEEAEREKDEEKKRLGIVSRRITRVFFKLDGVGFLPQERWHLWTVEISDGKARTLTSGDVYDEWAPAWSPDGKEIVFCSNRSADPDLDPDADDLFVVSLKSHSTRRIATPVGPKGSPRFSPDGKWIAYYGHEGKGQAWRQTRLWIVPAAARGKAVCLTEEFDFNVSPSTIADMGALPQVPPTWSRDGKSIFFQVAHHGGTTLKSVEVNPTPKVSEVITGPGAVGAFGFDRDEKTLLYFHGDLRDPGQVWVRDMASGRSRALTNVNARLLGLIDLGETEEVWFEGKSHNELQGWILTPPGFDRRRKYPSILEIHGGPMTQYGQLFMHEFYYLAAQGYVVYYSNPRGSQGYGEAHTKAIWNAWGTVDYEDLMAWVDLVEKRPYVDKKRMGVTGGSYGGYMTNWIIGHTHRFQAAVTQRCVSNFISMYGSSDFNWTFQHELGDRPPWEALEDYWRQSPIAHIGKATTPTLVIHNEDDHRCEIEQGEQVFVALKRLGVPTEMVRFPGEPHGLSRTGRTDRRIVRLKAISGWFDRHLKPDGR